MGSEPKSFSSDPFLAWIQESLTGINSSDSAREHEILELRELAERVETEVSRLSLPGATDRFKEGVMPPASKWFKDWLTFDPDLRDEADSPHLEHRMADVKFPKSPSWRSELKVVKANEALIDNTTIDLAITHFEIGEPPTALGLLDLANFVNNLVLRERLVALHHPMGSGSSYPTIYQKVGQQHLRLRDQAIIGSALLWIRELAGDDPKYSHERAEAIRTWSIITGTKLTPEKIFSVRLEDVLHYLNVGEGGEEVFNSPTTTIINMLYRFSSDPDLTSDRQLAAVQAANCRSLVNLEAARHFGIPYAAGITRLPMKRLLWSRGRKGDALLTALDKADLATPAVLDGAYRKRVAAALIGNEQAIVLPIFLAAIISRIDTLDQFAECIGQLRAEAAPLRRRLEYIEQALDSGPSQAEIRKLLAAFADDCRVLRRTIWDLLPVASAITGVVLTAATGQPAWLTAALAMINAGEKMHRQTWERLVDRIWRRDLWFISKLGRVGDELASAAPKLERLWGPYYDQSEFVNQLHSLRRLGTL